MNSEFRGTKILPENEFLSIKLRGKRISFQQALVMGIINLNNRSFYSGSRAEQEDEILQIASQHVSQGADFLDLGPSSSKPGEEVSKIETELEILLPAIELLRKAFPDIYISCDTYHSEVAMQSIQAGADMINDISAGSIDVNMFETIASLNVPYCLMHMQGTPATMQLSPNYVNVVDEVISFLTAKRNELYRLGVSDVIIDPGFGFGKSLEHNFQLLAAFAEFKQLKCPILAGLSRKSMISKILETNAEGALNGTTVLNTIALMKGASIMRVHDVKEAREAVKLIEMTKNPESFLTRSI
jgi:dihydropteroate synthase